jgi:hypothetical protein
MLKSIRTFGSFSVCLLQLENVYQNKRYKNLAGEALHLTSLRQNP